MKHLIASAVFAVVAAVAAAHFAVTNHDHRMDHQHWSHSRLAPIKYACPSGQFVRGIYGSDIHCEQPAQGGPTP